MVPQNVSYVKRNNPLLDEYRRNEKTKLRGNDETRRLDEGRTRRDVPTN